MKYLQILFNRKAALFETSRKSEPIQILTVKGVEFHVFDVQIYFDTFSLKGKTKKLDDDSRRVWLKIDEDTLSYAGGLFFGQNIEDFVKMIESSGLQRIVNELKDIKDNLSEYNSKIDSETEKRKIERLEREEQKRLEEEKSQRRFEEYILKSEELYKKGEYIQSDALEEIFKKYNVKVPLRTLGWIRRSLIEIRKDGSFKFRGKTYSESIARLRMELNSKLKECLG